MISLTNSLSTGLVLIDNLLIENFQKFPYDIPVCLKKEGIRFIGFNGISSKRKKKFLFSNIRKQGSKLHTNIDKCESRSRFLVLQ